LADEAPVGRVVILADDLIWADRLRRAAETAAVEPTMTRSLPAFRDALAGLQGGAAASHVAIVDLTARAYDGLAAIEAAHAAGVRVLAVGQHDDHALRKQALAAGAERVLAYQKLFADGPATIAAFVGMAASTAGAAAASTADEPAAGAPTGGTSR
jgi:ActR/RegA family two-component response regulator